MAAPQLENGHTQIANELLEHMIQLHLSPNQWQILLCVVRKTYGYHKKVDDIANSQIVMATGLCKAVVSRALHSLEEMRVITRRGKTIGVQKDWELWHKLAVSSTADTMLAEQSTDEKLAISTQELAISSSELAEQSTIVSSPAVAQKKKDTSTKETVQKKPHGEFSNVLLTDEEYRKLKDLFGDSGTEDRIEALALYVKSQGRKYLNHYATILSWDRLDNKREANSGTGKDRGYAQKRVPKRYSDPRDV